MNFYYKYKEDIKGLGVVLGLALFFFTVGYQCRKVDYAKVQSECIEKHKPLISSCRLSEADCHKYERGDCFIKFSQCIEPYRKCSK